MSETAFSSVNLRPDLLQTLVSLDYREMTPIQALSLPPILAGKDVIGRAMTGSGKTAAFGLGLLNKLEVKRFRVQALVLCPTRELADQVAVELRSLGRGTHNIKILTLCGGSAFGPQVGSLEHGAHIIVGTPGRVEEHLRKGNLDLSNLTTLVLDEADRMLDMGFEPTLTTILTHVPAVRQTLMFSATFANSVKSIANSVMSSPVMVEVTDVHDDQTIRQVLYKVEGDAQRLAALVTLILHYRPTSTLVFCNTKREVDEVANALRQTGFLAAALHGDMEQRDRDETLIRFANQSVSVLVATDVAARGLDIDQLDAVINFYLARELEVHVHRIGRTGRAGSKGVALTLYSDKEAHKLQRLEEMLGQRLPTLALPEGEGPPFQPPMLTLQIDGGKKQKLRPGDIVGALTTTGGIEGDAIGKIKVTERMAFVAVKRGDAADALRILSDGKLKGRTFRARLLGL